MDYDGSSMPAVYDAGRGYSPEMLKLWLTEIARAAGDAASIDTILDLGCGTGRYSGPLADYFSASVIALDPSEQMLAQARRKTAHNVTYVLGSGEDLPLEDASVDLVFISMVFHHFARPERVARECRRVLRAGGFLVMRTGVAERIDVHPYAPFFPRTERILRNTFASLTSIEKIFVDAGFELRTHDVIDSEVASCWSDYAERISLRADSILIQLEDQEFAAGLEKLRAYATAHPERQPVIEPTDLLGFRAAGRSIRRQSPDRKP
jgi:ubiquinone/menaquinone biosynthesis C-methylase UbiE